MPNYPVVAAHYWDGSDLYPVAFLGDPSSPATAPSAPTGLDAAVTSTTATLLWGASTPASGDGIDHYEVQRQTGPDTWVTVGTPGGSPFTVTGLSPLASYVFRVRGISDKGLPSPWATVATQTAAPAGLLVLAEAETSGTNSYPSLDSRLAARVGTSAPLLAGRHSYSGSSFPSSFSASTQQQWYTYGTKFGLLNVKCDWADLAGGGQDSKILGWAATIPSDFVLYVTANHEPENDGKNDQASVWRAGQARIANLIAQVNSPRLHYAVCHMGYTFESASGRNPEDWNPWPQMSAAAKARTIFGPDAYTKVTSTGGAYQSMDSKVGVAFAKAATWGAQRFAISEHALNNDVGASGAVVAGVWTSHILPWLRSKNLVYYAFYGHSGPAAGTSPYIDTTEEETVFGNFALEFRR